MSVFERIREAAQQIEDATLDVVCHPDDAEGLRAVLAGQDIAPVVRLRQSPDVQPGAVFVLNAAARASLALPSPAVERGDVSGPVQRSSQP